MKKLDPRDYKRLLGLQQVKNAGLEARLQQKAAILKGELGTNPLVSGSVNDLNMLMWSFVYNTEMTFVEKGTQEDAYISVNSEAPFVVTHMTRAMYEFDGSNLTFINPEVIDGLSLVPDFKYKIVDSSSGRAWSENPIQIENIGFYKEPTKFEHPFLLEPNTRLNFELHNSSNKDYFVSLALWGFRVRTDSIKNLMNEI